MSKYVVIKFFTDLQDNNYAYNVGDEFPHKGMQVSDKRLAELAGSNNKQHRPLIQKLEDLEEHEEFEEPEVVEPVMAETEPVEIEKPKERASRKRKPRDNDDN